MSCFLTHRVDKVSSDVVMKGASVVIIYRLNSSVV